VAALEDELAKYLSTPRDLHVKDGLRWWYDRKHLYPRLHRMAMDYLSIPGKFFFLFSIDCLLIYMISQPHQSTSNEFSARAGFSSHTYVVGYRFNLRAPFCVSEHGVY
jgi:hAT family C-terminal dimerisation region